MERFSWKTEKLQHSDDEVIMVVDNANKEWKGHILNIVDKLNELNDERMMYKTTIDKRIMELEEENKKLKHINDQLEERLENSGIGVALKMDCEKDCAYCKHFQIDGMFGMWCEKGHDWTLMNKNCSDFER